MDIEITSNRKGGVQEEQQKMVDRSSWEEIDDNHNEVEGGLGVEFNKEFKEVLYEMSGPETFERKLPQTMQMMSG